MDDNLLKYNYDDNVRVEPEWYVPIIPLVLANGADGIGTGWASRLPNYDVREIVSNIHRMLDGQEPQPMVRNVSSRHVGVLSVRYITSCRITIFKNFLFVLLHVMQLPSYKGFKGTIEELTTNQYMNSGEVAIIDETTIEISELPVKTWTQVGPFSPSVSFPRLRPKSCFSCI